MRGQGHFDFENSTSLNSTTLEDAWAPYTLQRSKPTSIISFIFHSGCVKTRSLKGTNFTPTLAKNPPMERSTEGSSSFSFRRKTPENFPGKNLNHSYLQCMRNWIAKVTATTCLRWQASKRAFGSQPHQLKYDHRAQPEIQNVGLFWGRKTKGLEKKNLWHMREQHTTFLMAPVGNLTKATVVRGERFNHPWQWTLLVITQNIY